MKFNRVFGAVPATVMAVTAITSSAAAKPDNLAYGYQAGRIGKPWNTAE